MKTIKQTYRIAAPVAEVWRALVDPAIIDGWGGGPAVMSEVVNSDFSLWGGDIHGRNIKIIPEKKLVQEWYSGHWVKPSLATFELFEYGEETRLELIHTDVPDDEADEIDQGWRDFYLGPIKDMLEDT
jgi:activator of HSP90 ATPase